MYEVLPASFFFFYQKWTKGGAEERVKNIEPHAMAESADLSVKSLLFLIKNLLVI